MVFLRSRVFLLSLKKRSDAMRGEDLTKELVLGGKYTTLSARL